MKGNYFSAYTQFFWFLGALGINNNPHIDNFEKKKGNIFYLEQSVWEYYWHKWKYGDWIKK